VNWSRIQPARGELYVRLPVPLRVVDRLRVGRRGKTAIQMENESEFAGKSGRLDENGFVATENHM